MINPHYPVQSLNNFTGTYCSILGKKFLITIYDDTPILINLNLGFKSDGEIFNKLHNDKGVCEAGLEYFFRMSNIVWLNKTPILVEKIEEGFDLQFDAIFLPNVGYQVILMWTGVKPTSTPVLNANDLLLVQENYNIPVHCITLENGKNACVYVNIDGCVKKIPISYKCVPLDKDQLSDEEIKRAYSIIQQSEPLAAVSKFISVNSSSKYMYMCNQIVLKQSKVKNHNKTDLLLGSVYNVNFLYELIRNEHCWMLYFDVELKLQLTGDEYFMGFNVNNNYINVKCNKAATAEFKWKSAIGKGHILFIEKINVASWHALIFELCIKEKDNRQKSGTLTSQSSLLESQFHGSQLEKIENNCRFSEAISEAIVDSNLKTSPFIEINLRPNDQIDDAINDKKNNNISSTMKRALVDNLGKDCDKMEVVVNNSHLQNIQKKYLNHRPFQHIESKQFENMKPFLERDPESKESKLFYIQTVENLPQKASIEVSAVALNKVDMLNIKDNIKGKSSSAIRVILTEFCKEILNLIDPSAKLPRVENLEKYSCLIKEFDSNQINSLEYFNTDDILCLGNHFMQTVLEAVDTVPQYIKKGCGKFICNKDLNINFVLSKLYGKWVILFIDFATVFFFKGILSKLDNYPIKDGTEVFFDAAFHNGKVCYITLLIYDSEAPNSGLLFLDSYYYFNVEGIYKEENNGSFIDDVYITGNSVSRFDLGLQLNKTKDSSYSNIFKKNSKTFICFTKNNLSNEFEIFYCSPCETTISVENHGPYKFIDSDIHFIDKQALYFLKDHVATLCEVNSTVTLSITLPNGTKLMQNINEEQEVYVNKSWVYANTLALQTVVHFDGIVSSEITFLLIWVSVKPDQKTDTLFTGFFDLPGNIIHSKDSSLKITLWNKTALQYETVSADSKTMIFDNRGMRCYSLKVNAIVLVYLKKFAFKSVCSIILRLSKSMAKQYLPLFQIEKVVSKELIQGADSFNQSSVFPEKAIISKTFESEKAHAGAIPQIVPDNITEGSKLHKNNATSINTEIFKVTKIVPLAKLNMTNIYSEFYINCQLVCNGSQFAILAARDWMILLRKEEFCSSGSKSMVSKLESIFLQSQICAFVVPLQKPIQLGQVKFTHRALVAWQGKKDSVSVDVDTLFNSRYEKYIENDLTVNELIMDDMLMNQVLFAIKSPSSIVSEELIKGAESSSRSLVFTEKVITSKTYEYGNAQAGAIPKIKASNKIKGSELHKNTATSINTELLKETKVFPLAKLDLKKIYSKFYINCQLVFDGSQFAIIAAKDFVIVLRKKEFCYSSCKSMAANLGSLFQQSQISAFVVPLQKPIQLGQVKFTHRALVAWQGKKASVSVDVDALFICRYETYSENDLSVNELSVDSLLMNHVLSAIKTPSSIASKELINGVGSVNQSSVYPEKIITSKTHESTKVHTGALPKIVACNKIKGSKLPKNAATSINTEILKQTKVFPLAKLDMSKIYSKFNLNCQVVFDGTQFAILAALNFVIILKKKEFCYSGNKSIDSNLGSLFLQSPISAYVVPLLKPIKLGRVKFTHRALVAWQGKKASVSVDVDTLFSSRFETYSEKDLSTKELSLDNLLMNHVLPAVKKKSSIETFIGVCLKSEKKSTLSFNNSNVKSGSLVNLSVPKPNRLPGNHILCKRLFTSSKGDLYLKVHNITGYTHIISGPEGILTMKIRQNMKTVNFYFHKKVCFINGKSLSKDNNLEFSKILKSRSLNPFFAFVYECKIDRLNGVEYIYSVGLLWHGEKPKNIKCILVKEPTDLNSAIGSSKNETLDLDKVPSINKKITSIDPHLEDTQDKSYKSFKSCKNIEDSQEANKVTTAKYTLKPSSSNSEGNLSFLLRSGVKDQVNIQSLKKPGNELNKLETYMQCDIPTPEAPVSQRKLVNSSVKNNKKYSLTGILKTVEETSGVVEAPDRTSYSFTREKFFLFGISLYKFSLKDIVKEGSVIEFEIDEFNSVVEAWIGDLQGTEEQTYSSVLNWCRNHAILVSDKLKLIAEINWIPPECDPMMPTDFEIVTL